MRPTKNILPATPRAARRNKIVPAATLSLLLLGITACEDQARPQQAPLSPTRGLTGKCEAVGQRFATGARCVIAEETGGTVDAAACAEPTKQFRTFGLTRHDADQIMKIGLEEFFKRYQGAGFCAYYTARTGDTLGVPQKGAKR